MDAIVLALALRQPERIQSELLPILQHRRYDDVDFWLGAGCAIIDSLNAPLTAAWMTSMETIAAEVIGVPTTRSIMSYLNSRLCLQRDGITAAQQGYPYPPEQMVTTTMEKQCTVLAAVLGFPAAESEIPKHLCGPDLELAEMCRDRQPPVPGENWPHPLFHPELWLWLALWLEHEGRCTEARTLALACHDPHYGLAQCQPGVERLLARLDQ